MFRVVLLACCLCVLRTTLAENALGATCPDPTGQEPPSASESCTDNAGCILDDATNGYTCQCVTEYYDNNGVEAGGTCTAKHSLGDTCPDLSNQGDLADEPCGDTDSVCKVSATESLTCQCIDTHFDDNGDSVAGGSCVLKLSLGTNSNCFNQSNSCADPNAECVQGNVDNDMCQCAESYIDNNGAAEGGTCIPVKSLPLGDACLDTSVTGNPDATVWCQDDNAECLGDQTGISFTCKCITSHFYNNVDSVDGVCTPKNSLKLGVNCPNPNAHETLQATDMCEDKNAECKPPLGDGSQYTCQCNDTHFDSNAIDAEGTCVEKYSLELGAICINPEVDGAPDSTDSCFDENAECVHDGGDSTTFSCQCLHGYYDNNAATDAGTCQQKHAITDTCPDPATVDAALTCADENARCTQGSGDGTATYSCQCMTEYFNSHGSNPGGTCTQKNSVELGGVCLNPNTEGAASSSSWCQASNSECLADGSGESYSCQCQVSYFDSNADVAGGSCVAKNSLELGEVCVNTTSPGSIPASEMCKDVNAECLETDDEYTCQCLDTYFDNNGDAEGGSCTMKNSLDLGETCLAPASENPPSPAIWCTDDNAECMAENGAATYACQCTDSHFNNNAAADGGTCIEKNSLSLNDACPSTVSPTVTCSDSNAKCSQNSTGDGYACQCDDTHFDSNGNAEGGNCILKNSVELGGVCLNPNTEGAASSSSWCQASNSECLADGSGESYSCQCQVSYFDSNADVAGGSCVAKNSLELGEVCVNTTSPGSIPASEMCKDVNAECLETDDEYTCQCLDTYFDNNSDAEGGSCTMKNSLDLGETCLAPASENPPSPAIWCTDDNAECMAENGADTYACQCTDSHFDNTAAADGGTCIEKNSLSLNDACPSTVPPTVTCSDSNAKCSQNSTGDGYACQCDDTHFDSNGNAEGGNCILKHSLALDEVCLDPTVEGAPAATELCDDTNARCVGNAEESFKCKCMTTYYDDNGVAEHGSCVQKKALGGECPDPTQSGAVAASDSCADTNAECSQELAEGSYTCQCVTEYFDDNGHTAGGTCVPHKSLDLGAICPHPDIEGAPDPGDTCSDTNAECSQLGSGTGATCQCKDTHFDSNTDEYGGNCIEKKTLALGTACPEGVAINETCSDTNAECAVVESTGNGYTCQCKDTHFDNNANGLGGTCIQKKSLALHIACPNPAADGAPADSDTCADSNARCQVDGDDENTYSCQCLETYFDDNAEATGGSCIQKHLLGNACSNATVSCADDNAVCVVDSTGESHVCRCKDDYFDSDGNAVGGVCIPERSLALGVVCPDPTIDGATTEACADTNAACIMADDSSGSYTCQCTIDYFDNNGENSGGTCILKKSLLLGDTCPDTSGVEETDLCQDENARCLADDTSAGFTCQCMDSHFDDNANSASGSCIEKNTVPLHSACIDPSVDGAPTSTESCAGSNTECLVDTNDENSFTCQCLSTHFSDNSSETGEICSQKNDLGSSCPNASYADVDQSCADVDAKCTENETGDAYLCKCDDQHFDNNGDVDGGACIPKNSLSLDTACLDPNLPGAPAIADSCADGNARCIVVVDNQVINSYLCQCMNTYFDSNANTTGGTCIAKKSLALGASCPDQTLEGAVLATEACTDTQARCAANDDDDGFSCQCLDSHFDDNANTVGGTCIEKKSLALDIACPDPNMEGAPGVGESCADGHALCVENDASEGYTCQCIGGYFDDNGEASGGTCISKQDLGSACPNTSYVMGNESCADEHAECAEDATGFTCQCADAYFDNNANVAGGTCIRKNTISLGKPCIDPHVSMAPLDTESCADGNALCLSPGDTGSYSCQCVDTHFDSNGDVAGGTCTPKNTLLLGSVCPDLGSEDRILTNETCQDTNAECAVNTGGSGYSCQCLATHFDNSSQTAVGVCVAKAILGETCVQPDACLTDNAVCDASSICACPPGYPESNGQCIIHDCGNPPTLLNGVYYLLIENLSQFGEKANVTCNPGYNPSVSEITCLATGAWSIANCNAKDCGQPATPTNGQVDISAGTLFGDQAIYKCNTGYKLVGNLSRECTLWADTVAWTGDPPTCDVQDCGAVFAPVNGLVNVSEGTEYGAQVTFSCKGDTVLRGGDVTITCTASGQWSGVQPICIGPDAAVPACARNIDIRNNIWEETLHDQTRTINCPPAFTGSVSRKCRSDGSWQKPLYSCIRNNVTDIADRVSDISADTDTQSIVDLLTTIQTATTQTDTMVHSLRLTDGELTSLTASLASIADVINDSDNIEADVALDVFVASASNLLDPTNDERWQSLLEANSDTGVKILTMVDALSETVSKNALNGTLEVVKPNVAIEIKNVSGAVVFPNTNALAATSWMKQSGSSIRLEQSALPGGSTGYVSTAVIYRNMTHILPPTRTGAIEQTGVQLNGPVLSLSMSPSTGTSSLNTPVTITLQHLYDGYVKPTCVFWHTTSGHWSDDGCTVDEEASTDSKTVCKCIHLTNFGVLMTPVEPEPEDKVGIPVIVGGAVSMLFLLITVVMHVCLWRQVGDNRTIWLMNLCVALIISYLLFWIGIDKTENEVGCILVATFIHYIYLVIFCLMLGESIALMFDSFDEFETTSRILILDILAWVLPALVVGISLGISDTEGYGTETFCWFASDDRIVWAFAVPAIVVVAFNIICVATMIRYMFQLDNSEIEEIVDLVKSSVGSMVCLIPLVAASWTLGLLHVNESSNVIEIVFGVVNALQGFFVFIWHCIMNSQVRDALGNKGKRNNPTLDPMPDSRSRSSTQGSYGIGDFSSKPGRESDSDTDDMPNWKDLALQYKPVAMELQYVNPKLNPVQVLSTRPADESTF